MSVDYEKFLEWAENKLGPLDIKGNEICVNSIFTDDSKKHLWCNAFGGTKKIKYGVYHCWKTDKKGTLVSLVMLVDSCGFKDALKTLGIESSIQRATDDIDFNFDMPKIDYVETGEEIYKELSLPPYCYKINLAPASWYQRAKHYLDSRKIFDDRFFVCTAGKFEGRIIIPYYSKSNKLIYFNGRTIANNELRYRGPDKSCGVGKEDVLFFSNYPHSNQKVYLCEGEFDALSLHKLGLTGVACGGKNLSEKQAVALREYQVCLALDADESGQAALEKMKQIIEHYNLHDITVLRPPSSCKDWNESICKFEDKIVLAYCKSQEKKFESEVPYAF